MKDIFTGLYNKVMSFFQTEKGDNTKDIASNRLKLVLMHDRTKLDPLTLEKMRNEMIDVISKYVIIDQEQLELNLAGEGDSVALMFNIPVVRAKTDEEMAEDAERRLEEAELAKSEVDDDEEETVNDEDDDEEENVDEEAADDEVDEEAVEEESENEESEEVDESEDETEAEDVGNDESAGDEAESKEEEVAEVSDEDAKPTKKSKKKSD